MSMGITAEITLQYALVRNCIVSEMLIALFNLTLTRNIQNVIKTMAIKDLKDTDFENTGKLAYLDETGILLYSMG